ncbi:probable 3',5'-cyclic phosphodiesterase pde-5 isoform X3 [Apostichopus japonicus]|uniref:probable 3',5'-cyclic phosphodiesterase pde-5 isoform X3 n=1 Tax=Stichopus japonicus TaxID=307972 RepID=UPI003AB22260
MSSPGRQVGNRRLPPLPASKKPAALSPRGGPGKFSGGQMLPHSVPGRVESSVARHHGTYSSERLRPSDMIITGQTPPTNNGLSRVGKPLSSGHVFPDSSETFMSDHFMQEQIRNFLELNPAFLEDYVLHHVNEDQVEKWLNCLRIQKTNRLPVRSPKQIQRVPSINARSPTQITPETNGSRNKSKYWEKAKFQDRRKLISDLTQELHQQDNPNKLLWQLTECIAWRINSDHQQLYLVTANGLELFQYHEDSSNDDLPEKTWKIGKGGTVAGHVAHTLHTIVTTDIKADAHPDGIGELTRSGISSVLSLPVFDVVEDLSGSNPQNCKGNLLGVLEFYRYVEHPGFTSFEETIANSFLVWGGVALHFAEIYISMTRQRKLNDFLLAVTRSIFTDIVSMDGVIMKIMNFAQKLVSADRASLFLVDSKTKELYARIFDIGNGLGNQMMDEQDQKEIRFPMAKGVAGHVASTGEILSIPDAYQDQRFNRDVDLQTGYKTKTILCMPIYNRGSIIGVVQMVNKKMGCFTKIDEEAFEMFAVYCGLALHHAKLYQKIRRSEQKNRVALEVLSYHNQCTDEEFTYLRKMALPEPIPDIARFDFSPWGLDESAKPLYVLCMFKDLFNIKDAPPEFLEMSQRFDYDELCRFILTVRKNYRKVPYHNWTHAFSVAHSVYTIIKTCKEMVFTPLECLALFVACLCHDLDHRGKNNSFMINSASPLAAVYSTSTMEHHHFNMTITILQHEGHNIFKHLTSDEYKQVLGDIRNSILATDLALFFGNKDKLKKITTKGDFNWSNPEHRRLCNAIVMTACDLCAVCKPFDIQAKVAEDIFEEFYEQGDEEKAHGRNPIPMMDRAKAHELPANQVSFIVGICLPCYDLLQQYIPNARPMLEGARTNLQNWSAIVAKQKAEEKDEIAEQENEQKKKEDKEEDKEKEKPESVATNKTDVTELPKEILSLDSDED